MPAKSKKQQKFFGVVRSVQKGETPAGKVGKKAAKAAKSMSKGDVEAFAKTKTKGLPEKTAKESFVSKLDAILETFDPKNIAKQTNKIKQFRKEETPTVEVQALKDDDLDDEFEDPLFDFPKRKDE